MTDIKYSKQMLNFQSLTKKESQGLDGGMKTVFFLPLVTLCLYVCAHEAVFNTFILNGLKCTTLIPFSVSFNLFLLVLIHFLTILLKFLFIFFIPTWYNMYSDVNRSRRKA